MANREADVEKRTGRKNFGQTFSDDGAERTFSTACRGWTMFCVFSRMILLKNQHFNNHFSHFYSARVIGFRKGSFLGILRNMPAFHKGSYQNFFQTFFFQKKDAKRVCINESTSE